ncbi:helix-turn-helix domain-containing protein [Lysinibacillus varians]|nr:helix-turn-helix transcriptional regulator [Lysinibacillus varians]AHN24242.1 hypothetical protein T479_12330 [Lysinibacillus varians]
MTNLYNEQEKKEIGQRIKSIRKSMQLTLKEFGEKFTPIASDSIVSRWERGVSIPSEERLIQIAEFGNIKPAYLISGHPFDNLTPEEQDGWIEHEIQEQERESYILNFKGKKHVQLEDFINPIFPRHFYINGHKLEKDEIEMLIKLFEGKEKNYPSDKDIENEYNSLREDYLDYLSRKEQNPKMLYFGESTQYKYHK